MEGDSKLMPLEKIVLPILAGVASFLFLQQAAISLSPPPCSEETVGIVHSMTPGSPDQERSISQFLGKRIPWIGLVSRLQETLWGTEIDTSCLSGEATFTATISIEVPARNLSLAPGQRVEALADLEGIDKALNLQLIHGQISPVSHTQGPAQKATTSPVPPQAAVRAVPMPANDSSPLWKDPITGMELVRVPGGCFRMGCGEGLQDCGKDEFPVHEVCVGDFWMGRFEVKQGEWKKVMGSNLSGSQAGDDFPVEMVSWKDAKEFVSRLKNLHRGATTFRLPTEAEWEYACRSGGSSEAYSGADLADTVAWYAPNSGGATHSVGTLAPNRLGLFDMSGNVREWCEDVYDPTAYAKHSRSNPLWSTGGTERVVRGGCWYFGSKQARCTNRYSYPVTKSRTDLGFRIVRVP
jgi:formylglycine-generating enzyme required for sulfatase activity